MSINPVNSYSVNTNYINQVNQNVKNHVVSIPQQVHQEKVNFGFFNDIFVKKFKTDKENQMYKELNGVLSGQDKKHFDILYKTGRLSDRTSNDGSSTLENLYKIYKTPRLQGLDGKKILSETIERLANPFVINQTFGVIPEQLGNEIIKAKSQIASVLDQHPYDPKTLQDLDVKNSASCVAASIEFSLADKKPAEYARFAEGLSGPDMAVRKNIQLSSLNKDITNSLYLLKTFNVKPYQASWKEAGITIAPDKDAVVRARVQSTQYNGKNRSSVDVLMQSAFMQLGSQATYNSLTDRRYGSLNANDTGLTEMEKTFVESVVYNDGEKMSVVYQNVDDNGILQSYYYPPETVKNHLISALDKNKNVIVGFTETDANKKVIGGHEITIIGYKEKNGELYFVYNDTDDNYVGQIEEKASVLLPKIHHAGMPVSLVPEQQEEDNGNQLLREFAEQLKQNNPKNAENACKKSA